MAEMSNHYRKAERAPIFMAAAAEEGKSLKEFFTEAVSDRLRGNAPPAGNGEPWRAAFGVAPVLDTKSLWALVFGDVALGRVITGENQAGDSCDRARQVSIRSLAQSCQL